MKDAIDYSRLEAVEFCEETDIYFRQQFGIKKHKAQLVYQRAINNIFRPDVDVDSIETKILDEILIDQVKINVCYNLPNF